MKKSGLYVATLALFGSREAIASEDTDEVKRLKSANNYFIEKHATMFDILSETLQSAELKLVYQKFGSRCADEWGAVKKTEP